MPPSLTVHDGGSLQRGHSTGRPLSRLLAGSSSNTSVRTRPPPTLVTAADFRQWAGQHPRSGQARLEEVGVDALAPAGTNDSGGA